ncbi:MAG: FHA domain-containing protein [Bdellovibrionales bacterium]
MAKLIVKKKGQVVGEYALIESKEWIAGRKPDADIRLDSNKGISREHFKLYCVNGEWQIESLSKLSNLTFKGAPVSISNLTSGSVLELPPYEFVFQLDDFGGPVQAEASPVSGLDQTLVQPVTLAAYIKMLNSDGDIQQTIELQGGDTWIAGRESSAQIIIGDHRVSRRQFEIRKTSLGYEIVDLGSVNGTFINEKLLESNDSILLKSGDVIRVLDHSMVFEIHDPQFFDKVERLPAPVYEEPPVEEIYVNPDMVQQNPEGYPENGGAGESQPQAEDPAAARAKKIQIAIGAIVALLVLVLVFDDGDSGGSTPQLSNQLPAAADPLASLTAQQKSEYRQSLELAKRYFMEGNYSLSLSEAEEMIKTYKVNDPELEKLKNTALAAIETQKQLLKQEKEEKERQIMETKISVTVAGCEKQLVKFNRESELDNCLIEALQLNPAHPSILAVKSELQAILAEREARKAREADYAKRIEQLAGLYQEAKSSERKKEYLDVIAAYKRVINSALPDPNGYKSVSERRLASLKIEMNKKLKQYEEQAEQYRLKKQYKLAVLTLRDGLKIDPSRKDIKEKAENIKNELRKVMMVYYQEGVLEESFGNVEGGDNRAGAKEKWKKILAEDLTDGEYYQKAYIKMKKYGAQ